MQSDVKAIAAGTLLAEAPSDQVVIIEGSYYFPPASLTIGTLRPSTTPYACPWKGRAKYFDVVAAQQALPDAAWTYPAPKRSAIERVGHDFTGYVAFDPAQIEIG